VHYIEHLLRYPYPIFELLSTWQRVLLFAVSALLMTGSTGQLLWADKPRPMLYWAQAKTLIGAMISTKLC
jgi:hypothetical protein